MPSDVKWRKREKRNDKEHHEKASFLYSWVFERFFFCFVFERTSSSLRMLFIHIGKSSSETFRSSRSQIFFKIGVLKLFPMFAIKNLCSSLFLINLGAWRPEFVLKKRFQHRCFPVNIAKFLRTAFLWNTFCSLYFYVMIEFLGRLWVQNRRVSYFLYYCFVFPHNSSVKIGSP